MANYYVLVLVLILLSFSIVFTTALATDPFCEMTPNATSQVRRLFVYRSCVYFSVISLQEESSVAAEVNQNSSDHHHLAIWHEYCLTKRAISAKRLSTQQLFNGHISKLDTAVELPIKDLSALDNLTATFPSEAASIILTFAGGHFHQALIQIASGHVLLPPNEALVKQLRFSLFLSGGKPANDTKHNAIDLLGTGSLRSVTYNTDLKHLYAFIAPYLAVFNLATFTWSFPVAERPIAGPTVVAKRSRDSDVSIMILYANRQLYVGHPKQVAPLIVSADLRNSEIDVNKSIAWQQFFNCFHNSPLLEATTSKRPFRVVEPILEPTTEDGTFFGKWNQSVLIIVGVALCLLTLAIGCVCIRACSRSSAKNEKSKATLHAANSATKRHSRRRSKSGSPRSATKSDSNSTSNSPISTLNFGQYRKKTLKTNRNNKRKHHQSPSDQDYSSKLSLFSQNSINLSSSMSTLRPSISRSSLKSLKTIKLGRVGSKDSLDSALPEPITLMPSSERQSCYSLGYLAKESTKLGGFKVSTQDPALEAAIREADEADAETKGDKKNDDEPGLVRESIDSE